MSSVGTLACTSVPLDEDVHIVPEIDEILDCDAWEIDHRSIKFCIVLKSSDVFIISGVPGEPKVSWIIYFMVEDTFLELWPISYFKI